MLPTMKGSYKFLLLSLCVLFLLGCTLGLVCPHDHGTSSMDCAVCLWFRTLSIVLIVYLCFILFAKHAPDVHKGFTHVASGLQLSQTLVGLNIKLSN